MEKTKAEKKIKEMKSNVLRGLAIVITLIAIGGLAWPPIKIWYREAEGRAQLKEAEWSRQIKIEEAKAELEASTKLAEAEIIRAKASAQACKLLSDAMQNNDAYIRYLWVKSLSEGGNRVIYIPTEANLPILEAKSEGVVKEVGGK